LFALFFFHAPAPTPIYTLSLHYALPILPSYTAFGFFPWASFLVFGMVVGSVIRVVKPEDLRSAMLWVLVFGVGLIVTAHQLSNRSEEHTSELQSQSNLVCRLLLEKKKKK